MVFNLSAQQSSKSKAKDKLYEKGGEEEVIIKNVKSINTKQLEFSPAFYQNGIVFISTSAPQQEESTEQTKSEVYFDLFYSEFDTKGQPTQAEKFSLMVNSKAHEGPVSFNKEGTIIYFTRNNLKNGKPKADRKSKARLQVYEAKKGKFDWQELRQLPFNNKKYSIAHPSLSADDKWLFFTSDMPGGFGGMDIYKVAKNGESWGKPINLGDKINTEKNELFPFIHESGTLFFASNGHAGAGGLDIFQAKEENGQWGNVANLGKPFNSAKDDLGLILNSSGTKGFFTSSRKGGKGGDDIYQFEIKEGIKKAEPVLAKIRIFDAQNNQVIDGASIHVFKTSADGATSENDLYDIVLVPSKENPKEKVMKLVKKNISELGKANLITDVKGKARLELKSGLKYIILVSKEGYENNEMIYSTNDKSGIVDLPISLKKQKKVLITIRVHDEKTNGVIPNTLVNIKNSCTNITKELQTNTNGQLEYYSSPDCSVSIVGNKEGFIKGEKNIKISATNKSYIVDLSLQPMAKAPEPIAKGTVIVLENIYYDFNKSYIRSGAAKELDELLDLLNKYPSMVIELVSHTDSRGGTRYNMQLSRKRAQSAKKYLVTRGIASKRIIAQGMGELEPRNRCTDGVDCSEKEFQYNRRTEVKVVSINESVKVRYRN